MRYTRCEACGAKALLAASQCPKCGHLLGLRDTRGVPVPLSHCRSCDSFYPSSRGACRWCGTTAPIRSSTAPVVWGVIGLVLIAGAVLGGRAIWSRRSASHLNARVATIQPSADTESAPLPSMAAADSAVAPAAATMPDTALRIPPANSDTALQGPAENGSTESDMRWVTATAITWANVRSDPDRQSGIVAVISPDTRVRLGDSKNGWHRVKAGGIEGWVDRRLFAMDDAGAAR